MKKLIYLLGLIGAVLFAKKRLTKGADEPAVRREAPVSASMPEPKAEVPLGGDVSQELLDILVCPEDKGSLELIDEGKYLLNPRKGYRYPIRDGIPIMLIDEGKANRVPV